MIYLLSFEMKDIVSITNRREINLIYLFAMLR